MSKETNLKKSRSKYVYPVIKNEYLVTRPEHLIEKCPVETTNERFAVIEEKKHTRPKKPKKKASSTECLNYWLKPGVSVPKFQAQPSFFPPEAGEPSVGGYQISHKIGSSSYHESIDSSQKEDNFSCSCELKDYESYIYKYAVGPSRCQFLFRVPSDEFVFHGFKEPKEEEHVPSHALQNWETWMKKRKHLHQVFGQKLDRSACELVINRAENLKKMNEDKEVYVYSQISKGDKWRGDPWYWKTPLKVPSKYDECASEQIDYFLAQTKLEKGIVPPLEFVGIPEIVQKEKGLLCESPININSLTNFWKKSIYRNKQYSRFKKQIKALQPNHIALNELAVVGTKILNQEEEPFLHFQNPNIPRILINDVEVTCDDYRKYDIPPIDERFLYPNENIACLRIMEDEIRIELSSKHHDYKENKCWDIDFGLNPIGTFTEKIFRVENKGTVTINYKWCSKKKKVPKFNLEEVTPAFHEPWFFFDKNPGAFLPGQIYEMKFYLHCKKAGVRTESWYLKTSPRLFKNREGAKILLMAVATDDSSKSDLQKIESYLKKRVGTTIVRQILHDMVYDLLQPHYNLRGIEYRSIFLEPSLFEYHNPKFYYNSLLVDELREVFITIPQHKQPAWDLSIDSLIQLVRKNIDGEQYYKLLEKISTISKKLFSPNYATEYKDEKYRMSYQVLCRMANYIDDDYFGTIKCFPKATTSSKEKIYASSFDYLEGDEYSLIYPNEDKEIKVRESEIKEAELEPEDLEATTLNESAKSLLDMNTIDFVYFQTLFYLKVYERICRAVEQIAGVIETRRVFEPWKNINYSPMRRL